jgi:hypothetical protein
VANVLDANTVVLCPQCYQPAQPLGLGHVDGLQRVTASLVAPGLHLAEDQDVTVAQDQVELAHRAPPVAVEHDHALLDEVPCGNPLTVGTECLLILAAHVVTSSPGANAAAG